MLCLNYIRMSRSFDDCYNERIVVADYIIPKNRTTVSLPNADIAETLTAGLIIGSGEPTNLNGFVRISDLLSWYTVPADILQVAGGAVSLERFHFYRIRNTAHFVPANILTIWERDEAFFQIEMGGAGTIPALYRPLADITRDILIYNYGIVRDSVPRVDTATLDVNLDGSMLIHYLWNSCYIQIAPFDITWPVTNAPA